MPDHDIAKLERQLQAEPDNLAVQLALIKARSRVEGPGSFLDLLNHRELWKLADESSQDIAIKIIDQRLQPDFAHKETELFCCGQDSAGHRQCHRIARFQHHKTTIEFHLLPAGRFLMGNPGIVKEHGYQGAPQRPAQLQQPFLIGRYPVTARQWNLHPELRRSWVEDSPRPLQLTTYREMKEWLKWAGPKLRIPTETEWEYACRAGTEGPYYWGPEDDGDWYYWSAKGSTHSVYAHVNHSNAFGLVDMLGNVSEVCYELTPEQERQVQQDFAHPREVADGLIGCGLSDIEEHGFTYCHDRNHVSFNDRFVSLGYRLVRPFTVQELTH